MILFKINWMMTQSKFYSRFRLMFIITISKKLSDKLKSSPYSENTRGYFPMNFQFSNNWLTKTRSIQEETKQRYHRSWLNTTEHTILCWSLELILLSVGQRPTILTCPISQNLRTNMSLFRLVLKFMIKPE